MNQELPTLLHNICLNIGIREPLENSDCTNIFNFLKRNFKLLTYLDVVKAFDLFSSQELIFKDDKFGHYGSFNLVFIGTVLKSYKEWKTKEALKVKVITPLNASHQIEEIPKTKEENAKEWYDVVVKALENNPFDLVLADWDAVYWHMVNNKMINLDKDEKEMFLDITRSELEEKIVHLRVNRQISKTRIYEKILNDENSLKRECRKRIIQKQFEG